jgi:hypothetical protein
MKHALLVLVVWAAGAVPVAAQVHECDVAPITSQQITQGAKTLQWCWNEKDEDGLPATPIEWAVIRNGVRTVVTGVTKGATPNAAGQYAFRVPMTFVKGPQPQIFIVEVVTADGVAQGDPLAVTVKGAGPSKPQKLRVS